MSAKEDFISLSVPSRQDLEGLVSPCAALGAKQRRRFHTPMASVQAR